MAVWMRFSQPFNWVAPNRRSMKTVSAGVHFVPDPIAIAAEEAGVGVRTDREGDPLEETSSEPEQPEEEAED